MVAIDQAGMTRMQRENRLHTVLLIIGMAIILGVVGWVWAGVTGIVVALVGVAITWVISPRMSNAVLRMYKAQRLSAEQAPALSEAVQELATRARLAHVPQLYWIPSEVMNAFATGQDENMVIAVSDGLVKGMGRREIVSVLAHEMSHLRNGDIKVMMFADALSRIISGFGQFGLLLLVFGGLSTLIGGDGIGFELILSLVVAPAAATYLQLALSRTREYNADLGAVDLTNDPDGMIMALRALENNQGSSWESIIPTQRRRPGPSAMRTHPALEDRIARIQEMKTNAVSPNTVSAPYDDAAFDEIVGMDSSLVKRPRYHLFNGLRY